MRPSVGPPVRRICTLSLSVTLTSLQRRQHSSPGPADANRGSTPPRSSVADVPDFTRNLFASITGATAAPRVDALEDYLSSDVIDDVVEDPISYWATIADGRNAEKAALARMAIHYLGVPGMFGHHFIIIYAYVVL